MNNKTVRSFFLHFLFLLVLITSLQGQSVDTLKMEDRPFLRRTGSDVKNMGLLVIETYKRPFHWKKKEWITFGAVIGGAALLTTVDEPVYNFFQDRQSGFIDDVSSFGDFMGKPLINYSLMVSIWGVGEAINNTWMRETGIMMIGSVTASGLIQTFSKSLTGRARPSTGEGPYKFTPFEGGGEYHSLPSGHTTLAFALNWVLARQIKWLPAKILFYSIPVIVGLSRIYDGAHWFSDVFLGAALGIAGAETALHIYPRLKAKDEGLTMGPTSSGLGLVYKF